MTVQRQQEALPVISLVIILLLGMLAIHFLDMLLSLGIHMRHI